MTYILENNGLNIMLTMIGLSSFLSIVLFSWFIHLENRLYKISKKLDQIIESGCIKKHTNQTIDK